MFVSCFSQLDNRTEPRESVQKTGKVWMFGKKYSVGVRCALTHLDLMEKEKKKEEETDENMSSMKPPKSELSV